MRVGQREHGVVTPSARPGIAACRAVTAGMTRTRTRQAPQQTLQVAMSVCSGGSRSSGGRGGGRCVSLRPDSSHVCPGCPVPRGHAATSWNCPHFTEEKDQAQPQRCSGRQQRPQVPSVWVASAPRTHCTGCHTGAWGRFAEHPCAPLFPLKPCELLTVTAKSITERSLAQQQQKRRPWRRPVKWINLCQIFPPPKKK